MAQGRLIFLEEILDPPDKGSQGIFFNSAFTIKGFLITALNGLGNIAEECLLDSQMVDCKK